MTILLSSCDEPIKTWPNLENYGTHRSIAYTDKGRSILYLATDTSNTSPWHGFTVSKQKIIHGIEFIIDGKYTSKTITNYSASPFGLKQVGANGLELNWTLLDTLATVLIEFNTNRSNNDSLRIKLLLPKVSHVEQNDNEILIAFDNNTRIYDLAIQSSSQMTLSKSKDESNSFNSSVNLLLNASKPGWMTLTAVKRNETSMKFDDEVIEEYKHHRQERLENRLFQTMIQSNVTELDSTIFWANTALDALIMNQLGKGIYAGLPWFDDYWGRDTFISFAGAVLVTGEFETAREILLSFAELQDKDPNSQTYGRVPNRAMPIDIIYNTVDGTPWFVRSVWAYYRYTGDQKILEEMWPAIKMATDGALRKIDENGFLLHDDADTWMDAKGADGPWSPRGNRAIDIQQLWLEQLKVAQSISIIIADVKDYRPIISMIEANLDKFRDSKTKLIMDHINRNGSLDTQIRPNALLIPSLNSSVITWDDFKYLSSKLVTLKGVLSLAQEDSYFHPYHILANRYVKDEAYHNGIIWTWNSGPVISHAYRFNQIKMGETLFNELGDLVIHRGALGGIAEVTDAWPRQGKDELQLSGTYSQAWSLAEYLRTFNQDILGIRPDMSRCENAGLLLKPRLLEGLNDIKFRFRMGNEWIEGEYVKDESQYMITLSRKESTPINLTINLLVNETEREIELNWKSPSLVLNHVIPMNQWTVPDGYDDAKMRVLQLKYPMNTAVFSSVNTEIKPPVLEGPRHRLLTPQEIKNPVEPGKIIEFYDDVQDDVGANGEYIYPLNRSFQKGIADIKKLEIKQGEFFTEYTITMANLVDPGWHPEYGYQLTYVAIGLDINDGKGASKIGRNAHDYWQNGFKADYSIYVSGGILILDDKLKTVAEFLPSEPAHAIGNVNTNQIKFSLPNDIFETSSKPVHIQVAVGLQDDHGGAGLGDFRQVRREAGEWWGGGADNSEASRVYDWLISK